MQTQNKTEKAVQNISSFVSELRFLYFMIGFGIGINEVQDIATAGGKILIMLISLFFWLPLLIAKLAQNIF